MPAPAAWSTKSTSSSRPPKPTASRSEFELWSQFFRIDLAILVPVQSGKCLGDIFDFIPAQFSISIPVNGFFNRMRWREI